MDRLNKKCFIASAGMHLLIGLVAFVGPAFTTSTPQVIEDLQIINFEPDFLVDQNISGGGNLDAGRRPDQTPPPPAPKPQDPPPQPKPVEPKSRPEPAPAEPPKPRPDPESFEVSEKKQPKRPQVNLEVKTRKNPAAAAEKQAQEKRMADVRRQADRVFGEAVGEIRGGVNPAAVREGSFGPGGGGPSYAGYEAWVWTVFDRAWIAPDDVTVENALAKVRVVIAPDGAILKAEFTLRSGDRQVDASIQRALDRVKSTGIGKPFPTGSTDKQRVYIIPFDLTIKRGVA